MSSDQLAHLLSQVFSETPSSLAALQEATREGGFEIRTTLASYVVSHEGQVYLFQMDVPSSPDKELGSALGYMFTTPDEPLDEEIVAIKANLKVVQDADAIIQLQDMEGPLIPWLLMTSEQITEINALAAQYDEEEVTSKTIH
jgi:hypothetical protein